MDKVIEINLKSITLDGNVRKTIDGDSIKELAASIKQFGLRNAIEVRKEGEKFLLLTGYRRYLAHKENKAQTIIAKVTNIKDEDVAVIQLIENIHREDLDPLQEAEAIQKLLAKKFTIKDIAIKLGKSEYYTATRIKLNHLRDEWKKAYQKGTVSISALTEIAKLPEMLQKDLTERGFEYTVEDIINYRKRHQNNLALMPWKLDWGSAFKVGACSVCNKRTGANTELFPEISKGDHCLDPACMKNKLLEWTKGVYDKNVKANPDTIFVTDEFYVPTEVIKLLRNVNILNKEQYTTREGSKGSAKAVVIYSENARKIGNVISIKVKEEKKEKVSRETSSVRSDDPKVRLARRMEIIEHKARYEKSKLLLKAFCNTKIKLTDELLRTMLHSLLDYNDDKILGYLDYEKKGETTKIYDTYIKGIKDENLASVLYAHSQVRKIYDDVDVVGRSGYKTFNEFALIAPEINLVVGNDFDRIDKEAVEKKKKLKDRFAEKNP